MALINFKGKNAVWNHHLSVPYQILEKDKDLSLKGKNEDENLIIEADNLIALKSLLPKYQGRIKCIYIDPPYNTGNENWVYNDKSNSPQIKDWIGKTVGADDLTRHDKWLCMMTPRLKLLHELLSSDGVIFISINDNELHHLRSLMDEVFNEENFVQILKWKRKKQPSFLHGQVASVMEYIMVFAKNKTNLERLSIETRSDIDTRIDNAGNHLVEMKIRKGIRVKLSESISYIKASVYKNKTMQTEYLSDVKIENGRTIDDVIVRAQFRNDQKQIDRFIDEDVLFITKNYGLRRDLLPEERDKRKSITDLLLDWGDNQESDKEINDLFPEGKIFEYPKPSKLIKNLVKSVEYHDDEELIVLDSFAGSGTTAQAVVELNKDDGGNRKFILIQLEEEIKKQNSDGSKNPAYEAGFKWVHEITRERVKRVMGKNQLSVGFTYMQLGHQIDAESILSGALPSYKEFAKYVYYLATGKTMDDEKLINEKNYYVGKVDGQSIYLIYVKDRERLKHLSITLEWSEKVSQRDKGRKLVYAPACFLDEEYLEKFNMSFVSIPYSLFEKSK